MSQLALAYPSPILFAVEASGGVVRIGERRVVLRAGRQIAGLGRLGGQEEADVPEGANFIVGHAAEIMRTVELLGVSMAGDRASSAISNRSRGYGIGD